MRILSQMGFPNLAGSSPAMGYPGPSPGAGAALASPGTCAALALPGPGAGHSAPMAGANPPTFGNVGASVFGQAAVNPTFGHTAFGHNVGNSAAFGHAAMTAVGHPGITGVHPAAVGHGGPSAAFGHAGVYPAAVPKAAFPHAGVHPAAVGHPGSSPGFGMAGPSPGFGNEGPSPTPAPLPLQWGKDDANINKPSSRVLKEHKTI